MTSPDLRVVDELCRLAVAARKVGCRVHLAGSDPELRSLLELAGVDDVLGECPAGAEIPTTDRGEEDLR
jgi:anti-anti-sigma regulatory factor